MEDAEIRREYFRRFRIAAFLAAGIGGVFFLFFMMWKTPGPFIALWICLMVMLAVVALSYSWYHCYQHRERPIFSRLEKSDPTKMDPEVFVFIFGVLAYLIVPDLIRGKTIDWAETIYIQFTVAFAVGPPSLWLRKWRLKTVAQLPSESPLIERSS